MNAELDFQSFPKSSYSIQFSSKMQLDDFCQLDIKVKFAAYQNNGYDFAFFVILLFSIRMSMSIFCLSIRGKV